MAGNRFPKTAFLYLWFTLLVAGIPPCAQAIAESADDTEVVAAYTVAGNAISPDASAPESAKLSKTAVSMWNAVRTIIPSPLLAKVTLFEIFDATDPEAPIFTDAYATLNDDGKTFSLGLNRESATAALINRDPEALKEFRHTIIHEFGHVLSIGPDQMDDNAQGTLSISEGILKETAYLNEFYTKFWKPYWPDRGEETLSDDEGTALFEKNPGMFVTEYAATGPLEDFAETFARFIIDPKPTDSAIKSRKILYFYSRPELVSLRASMQKSAGTK